MLNSITIYIFRIFNIHFPKKCEKKSGTMISKTFFFFISYISKIYCPLMVLSMDHKLFIIHCESSKREFHPLIITPSILTGYPSVFFFCNHTQAFIKEFLKTLFRLFTRKLYNNLECTRK